MRDLPFDVDRFCREFRPVCDALCVENASHVERHNRMIRQEWLGQFIFNTIEEIEAHATRRLWIYNNQRPNIGIGGMTPP